MQVVLERYASRGYIALAPDLFWRVAPGVLARDEAGMKAANERKNRVDPAQCLSDIGAAVEALRAMPQCEGNVALAGFCFGGRYAFLGAAHLEIAAAAAFHPTEIGASLEPAPRIKHPLSLHFAEEDAVVPLSEVDTIARALQGQPNVELFTYPKARHSFAVPQTHAYDTLSATLAEERAFALFDRVFHA